MKLFYKSFLFFLLCMSVSRQSVLSQATCATALPLTSGITCTAPTSGTFLGGNATASGSLPAAVCGNAAAVDVWYSFVAQSQFPTVTLSSVGAGITTAGPRTQILSNVCSSAATVYACGTTTTTTPGTPLTIGTTYLIRVTYNAATVPSGTTWTYNICITDPTIIGSRMNEVFKETILHGTIDATLGAPYPIGNMYNPWEITYGPDGFLWITEARGYRVRRMNPTTGAVSTVLELSKTSTGFLSNPDSASFNCKFDSNFATFPQGGMMGFALHPDFMKPVNPQNYVFIGYVYKFDSTSATANGGNFFRSKIVRFKYDTLTFKLGNPVSLCDTIPGSNDHNSGRMIIAPVDGVNYLFYAVGDMGSGNFANKVRANKAQNPNSYEGKILRFRVDPDANADLFDRWIPDSSGVHNNPFNGAKQSAVYTIGVRNNQGFAYNPTTYKLYGAEHGMFADDEINIIEAGKNYGHPLVEGYNDGNYNNAKAGSSSGNNPLIVSEAANATAIGVNFRQPIYSFFPAPNGPAATVNTILNIYNSTTGDPGSNANTSVAHSGMDIYTSSFIPGWRNSLMTAAMKRAKFFRLKLNDAGDVIMPTPAGSASPLNDTVGVFWAQNRYRDLAFSPDGKTIFACIDKDQTTSGPTAASPQASQCPGCIKKFEFLGYNDNAGISTISTSIPVAPGVNNQLTNGTPTAITSSDNNNLWVPITDSLGNIIAEIDANGNNLGNITASLYKNSGVMRSTAGGTPYLDRSFSIHVQNQPATNVNVRLYVTAAELAAIVVAPGSGVSDINTLYLYKNSDSNGTTLTGMPTAFNPTRAAFGSNYVLTASISGFSTFYFAGPTFVLPVTLLSLNGKYIDNAVSLIWKTESEINSSYFIVERSIDGRNFSSIGNVPAAGNSSTTKNYSLKDYDVFNRQVNNFYYRLKMVDNNGSFKYSGIINIALPGAKGIITLSPNPATDNIKAGITSATECSADWQVIDIAGRVLIQSNASLKKGNNELMINISSLASGTYYLKVQGTCI
jgi:trimeric autotransporter adhesin